MSNAGLMGIVAWIVGVLVSLAVGFGMIGQTLTVPFIPEVITVIAGWVVVIGAVIGVIMAIFAK
ncbi:hypothetical protein CMI37_26350 [Candidatus Pacearchaeota archaeon]|nr:hypothetical protein [Candidatus Pacearchaeota archaeon]|tara:strand:+ start:513 stop:704 length:192 start_codon:yes stop_codon:yes gene_type:complete